MDQLHERFQSWADQLVDLTAKNELMSLYLTGSATREIIFNPIRSNIAEAHSQIATLLEREYQPEDLKRVPLCSPAVLSDMMSKMSSKF